jgi:single-strand DNA-binding protein
MAFDIIGKAVKIFDAESKSATFKTREFVISTEETYPQFVKFQATQDRCSIVDGINEGDKIKVHFDLTGREWQGKYFTNLTAWKIEKQAADAPAVSSAPSSSSSSVDSDFPPFEGTKPASGGAGAGFDDFGDLPF